MAAPNKKYQIIFWTRMAVVEMNNYGGKYSVS